MIGCATVTETSSEEAIRGALERIIAADNAGDLEAVLAIYDDDAVLLPPDGQPVRGKQAIGERYRDLFRTHDLELAFEIDEVASSGDLGFARGRTSGTATPRDGGAPAVVDDLALVILRKGGDGRWRILRLMWHHRGRGSAAAGTGQRPETPR